MAFIMDNAIPTFKASHSPWSLCHFHFGSGLGGGSGDDLQSSSKSSVPSGATVCDHLIIRARKRNEIVMEYVMFWAKHFLTSDNYLRKKKELAVCWAKNNLKL